MSIHLSSQTRKRQASTTTAKKSHPSLRDTDPEVQYRLTSLLQTTLELEPLFELFFGQLQHLLKMNSCHFTNADKHIDLLLGTKATHSCEYTLTIQQQYLGKISFSRKQRFTSGELMHIEELLGTLVFPLRNSLNYQEALNQALRDPLTSLGNRAALENTLEHQWQMAKRYDQELGLLMIDIDHFKSINDKFGHDVGDYVIKEVARTIDATTRQTDLAYRYGGEEFLVLLHKTTLVGSTIIAERIRENIDNLQLHDCDGNPLKVTVSIGGTHYRSGVSKQQFLKEADLALYTAKDNGRNQVEFFKNEEALEN